MKFRPDMTFAVDWALKTIPIYLVVKLIESRELTINKFDVLIPLLHPQLVVKLTEPNELTINRFDVLILLLHQQLVVKLIQSHVLMNVMF